LILLINKNINNIKHPALKTMRRHFCCFSKYFTCSLQSGQTTSAQEPSPSSPPVQIDLYDSDDDEAFEAENKPKYNMKNTIPFIPPVSGGIVIKVQENAVIIASKLSYHNSPMYRFHIRLQGIQFPSDSIKSQEALEKYILYKEVTLQNVKTDKYGGLLADVYVRNRNINQWLLENKHATLYRGKKNGTPKSRI